MHYSLFPEAVNSRARERACHARRNSPKNIEKPWDTHFPQSDQILAATPEESNPMGLRSSPRRSLENPKHFLVTVRPGQTPALEEKRESKNLVVFNVFKNVVCVSTTRGIRRVRVLGQN